MAKKKEAAAPEQRLQEALVPCTEWPYKLPENWCWVKLQYICNYIKAGGDKPKELSSAKDDVYNIPVIANGIENDGIIGYSIIPKEDAGTITVSGRGTIGVAICRDYEYIPVVRLIVISPSKAIYSNYLKYVFDFLEEKGTGSSIPQLTVPMVKGKSIPLAPLPEQRRIVERLESLFAQLDEAREKAQSALDSFESRKAAILHKAFTGELTAKWREEHGVGMDSWNTKNLQSVCITKITDGTHKTPTYCEENEGFPFISSKDVTSEHICWDKIKYIPPILHEELHKRLAPQKGDVLLAKNGTTGVAAIVEDEKVFDLYVTLAVLRPNKEIISSEFLWRIVNSPICKNQFNDHLTGIGVPNLHLRDIKEVQIPVPSLSEQQEIVRILDSLLAKEQQAKEAAEAVLEQIDLTKKSILSRAFRGGLGTNDPTEESAVELIKQIFSEKLPEEKKPVKRITIPKEITQRLESPLEKKIIRAFYDQDTRALDTQTIFQLGSKPVDTLKALQRLLDKNIIEKDENKIFLKLG